MCSDEGTDKIKALCGYHGGVWDFGVTVLLVETARVHEVAMWPAASFGKYLGSKFYKMFKQMIMNIVSLTALADILTGVTAFWDTHTDLLW
jgi:hypothetical protein